jgi:Na+/H+ antiporter NhaD/arsenite permease-like protein
MKPDCTLTPRSQSTPCSFSAKLPKSAWPFLALLFMPATAWPTDILGNAPADLTGHWVGFVSIAIFVGAYALAVMEESLMLRKSKPMVFAGSLIWTLIAAVYIAGHFGDDIGKAFRSILVGYAKLFLFILVSMTYLNAMEQRGVFDTLRVWLLSKGYSYRKLFWITGIQAFLLSAVCSNLTTALLMGSVVIAMGGKSPRFVAIACVNIVVATNAGGSFSPFGDITTLLVWQKGIIPFTHFFSLFLPSLANFVVPAAIMHFWIPKEFPEPAGRPKPLQHGAKGIIVLFILTIATAVYFENSLGLPPAAGMMAGLTYLSFYFFYLYKSRVECSHKPSALESRQHFDVFHSVARLEWDTLLYFYGVMACVGGLSFIGYLSLASGFLYTDLSPTLANILIGLLSAFIDNGTIMYTVLAMAPPITEEQWLLVTLTTGVGGSLLAIGSAAGIGLMGQSKGAYSFASHLKWTPVIALGYAASIALHLLLSAGWS